MDSNLPAASPVELMISLKKYPSDWNQQIDCFAFSKLGLKEYRCSDGGPALKRADGRLIRFQTQSNQYFVSLTSKLKPVFIPGDAKPVSAEQLVAELVAFANEKI